MQFTFRRRVFCLSIAVLFAILINPGKSSSAYSQGTCAVVYEATPSGNEGSIVYFGAAWGRASLQDAQNAALAQLKARMNGAGINPNVGIQNGPEPGVWILAQGCEHAHGVIVGVPNSANDGTFNDYYSAFADTTEDAMAAAVKRCRSRLGSGMTYSGTCGVQLQW